jgi:hypothetical protein
LNESDGFHGDSEDSEWIDESSDLEKRRYSAVPATRARSGA